jgi:ParB family chromosome partitioning protein
MASSKTAKKAPKKKRRAPRKKSAPKSKGLSVEQVAEPASSDARALAEAITKDGGRVLASYKEPLGGHEVLLAALPLDKVEPTPYQRDLSEPHVKRLANAMERVDRFLDPVITVRHDGAYWTPNGLHRLGASKLLGLQTMVALVLPEPDLAFQILALNTEKAHNLKERSLEVIRMVRGMLSTKVGNEVDYAPLFEEPAFVTLGVAYEKRPRFSAGAYHSIVKRVDTFLEEPLVDALEVREERAAQLLALDDEVARVVEALKQRGLVSPYLKYFVVGRINYLRFKKGPEEFDDALEKLTAAARKFNVERVRREDIGRMGGGGEAATDAE